MLSKQFLLATQLPTHPNNCDLNNQNPPRIMKHTLITRHGYEISNRIPAEGLNTDNYKTILKNIHTESVAEAISNQENNKVLNEPAPQVHKSELELPKRTTSVLSQLRSSYSSHLQSFLYSIGKSQDPNCPDCHTDLHTTNHLFNCPANPTSLPTIHQPMDPPY